MSQLAKDTQGNEVKVVHEPEKRRYAIYYTDGQTKEGEPASMSYYLDRPGARIFFHTETKPQFGGRGLADIVVTEALENTVAEHPTYRINPMCPFVRAYIEEKGLPGR